LQQYRVFGKGIADTDVLAVLFGRALDLARVEQSAFEQLFKLGIVLYDVALAQKHIAVGIVDRPGQRLSNGECAGGDTDEILHAIASYCFFIIAAESNP
jgi:hypothetical protein